jgi:pimeloyl-ACP methyl ester carboxylesterase
VVAVLAAREHEAVPLVAVNDVELYYESHGLGAPLMVLGGLGLNVSEMEALTGPLAERFQVIAVDKRGTGRRQAARPVFDRADGADAAGLMDWLACSTAAI